MYTVAVGSAGQRRPTTSGDPAAAARIAAAQAASSSSWIYGGMAGIWHGGSSAPVRQQQL
jgi:hypothetical protein